MSTCPAIGLCRKQSALNGAWGGLGKKEGGLISIGRVSQPHEDLAGELSTVTLGMKLLVETVSSSSSRACCSCLVSLPHSSSAHHKRAWPWLSWAPSPGKSVQPLCTPWALKGSQGGSQADACTPKGEQHPPPLPSIQTKASSKPTWALKIGQGGD